MSLYPFDAETRTIQFNGKPNSDKPVIVTHVLRKPTLGELLEHEAQTVREVQEVNKNEDRIVSDTEKANANLWDKLILKIQGYRGFDQEREPSADEKAQMRPGHKSTAVLAMYDATAEVEDTEDGLGLSGDKWRIKHGIGPNETPDFTVYHILREPNEDERIKFKRTQSSQSLIRGKKTRIKLAATLKAHVELYDALLDGIEGGTVNGETYSAANREAFIKAIDPFWKRQVVAALMDSLEAALLD